MKMTIALKSKVVQDIFGKTFVLTSLSSAAFRLQNCFTQKIKGFYQSSLGYEVHFRYIINVSSNILPKY